MNAELPVRFHDIAREISTYAGIPLPEAEERVWREALDLGSNVAADARRFAVTPHVYDEKMERLYRESDSFIFETMVFWATPVRQRWIDLAIERMRRLAVERGVAPSELSVLMLGDGAGSDSLKLVASGFRVVYFDVPGSRTFAFALRRFEARGVLGREVTVVTAYEACFARPFDVVLSFEVLEHLPDPVRAIRDMRRMLAVGGIALVTESFGLVSPRYPTHLASNVRYAPVTPLLFLQSGLVLSWYSVDSPLRPVEFRCVERVGGRQRLSVLCDRGVLKAAAVASLLRLGRRFVHA